MPRDSQGNAMLVPAGGTIRAAYTPASGLGDYLENKDHIHRWQQRYLARGMGVSPDLCALAASEPYHTGFGAEELGREKAASGRRLDAIIERALDRVRIHEKADYGTAVHSLTEPDNDGVASSDRIRADVESFEKAIKDNGIKILDTEVFTANDQVMAAGTFDHLCWVPGYGVVVCDKKTGRMNDFGVQLSVYAKGQIYDRDTDQRTQLEALADYELNDSVGILFAIHDGRTEIHEIDLDKGWRDAQLAAKVRDQRNSESTVADAEPTIQRALRRDRAMIAEYLKTSQPANHAQIWRDWQHIWTDELTELAKTLKGAA